MDEIPNLPDYSYDPTAILVYGGGGHGKTLVELVQSLGCYNVIGVIDELLTVGENIVGVPVLGGPDILSDLYKRGIRQAINGVGGIGNPAVRIKIFEQLAKAGFVCPTVIHPTAYVEPSAVLEPGVQVLAQAYIGSDSKIGFGSVINAGVVVSHDCRIGKVVNLSPGAMLAGNVTIEDYAQIGMGATVNLHITVGSQARIGNGATVKADVPGESRVYAGTIWPVRM
jgi:sugar O-acyltransferase (sialic acid O-acetyltransferase NeuD family)